MKVVWRRPSVADRSVDAELSSGKPGNADGGWAKREIRHPEVLESELLMVRPMRFSGRVEIFEPDGRHPAGEQPMEHLARADAISVPDIAALDLGTLITKAIAGRMENSRILPLSVTTWALLFLAIGFGIGWLAH